VDHEKVIRSSVVEAVARDFDLGETSISNKAATTQPTVLTTPSGEKLDLVAALKTLVTLADRLRESEQEATKERKL
jgi:hypothetical protein